MRSRNRLTTHPLRRRSVGAVAALGLVLAGLGTAATSASAEDVVLLDNGFEDGTYAPWGPRGSVTLAVTDAEARTGTNSLSVSGRTGDWQGPATDAAAIFEPGEEYTVSAWVKLPAGTAGSTGIHFTAEQVGASTTYSWVGGAVATTADGWVQIGGTYTLPEGLSRATLYIEAAAVAGVHPSFLVDDVLVTGEGEVTEPGVALSTDFESGLDGWGPRAGGGTAPVVGISTADAASGSQSALVSGRDGQGDGLGRDVTGLLTEGTTYDVSAQVRFAAGAATDDVWLSMARTVDGTTSYSTLGQFDAVSNSGWTEVSASFTMGAADSAYLYFETAYSGTNTSDFLVDDVVIEVPEPAVVQDLTGIKETADFPVGVAIDSRETAGSASDLLVRHFDQITAENHMKPEAWYDADRNFRLHPEAATLMQYAQDNDLRVYGHVLAWHSQTPAWFFQDAAGQPLGTDEASKQVLRDRLHEHIDNVAEALSAYGEFGGGNPVVAFDVVNEVVSDGGEYADGLRRSEWYRILGEEFIDLAFQYADEAFNGTYAAEGADRPVTLFINDYNTEQGGKQTRYHDLVSRLLARGVPVDGVGHQFHVSLAMPISALDAAIARFEDLPVTQAVTELDVTVGSPVTQANLIQQGYYFRDAFRSFRAHADDLFSVTVWGLTDGRSWRASSGAPLVFDDGFQAKPAYYGAVDGELPARARTATVFAGDVALDAAATTSAEWSRLPLHAIEDTAQFQLRWAPDHLTAYVAVSDTTSDGGDSVAFQLGSATYTVNRDGSGPVPAVTSEREGGWAAVVHLPATAAQGGTLALDVRVADGGVVTGWNTPGVTGSLTLVEGLSYLEVTEARTAPAVDGTVDATWSDAGVVTTAKQVSGTDGAAADVRTLWQDGTLYVLAEVTDPVVDVSGSDPWIQDSVEIYVDPGNAKNGSYRYDDTQIRISADNAVSFGTGDEAFQRNRVVSATTRTATGYVVEAAISLLEYGGLGTFHGLDFQVNDASGGARTSIRNWADPTGAGYQSTARWGVGQLVGPVEIVNLTAPAIIGSPVKGSVLTADAGTWSVPVTVTYQWLRDGEPIVHADDPAWSATARTYKVTKADEGHELSVVVTASADGFDPVAAESAPVTVCPKHAVSAV